MNEQQPSGGFMDWVKAHPLIITLFVVVAIFGVIFLKRPTATTSTSSQADLSGLATDVNGNKLVYRDVADTFINVNKTIGSYNTTTSAVEHPIEPTAAIIRASEAGTKGPTAKSDVTALGPIVRATPDLNSAIVGYAPFNSSLGLSGTPITGTTNLGVQYAGTDVWFPTSLNGKNGYISAYDISNLN